MPNGGKVSDIFDLRINLPTIISFAVLIFSAAIGVAKLESKYEHDADMQRLQQIYMRQDVTAATQRDLDEWRSEIRADQARQREQLERIERKIDNQKEHE